MVKSSGVLDTLLPLRTANALEDRRFASLQVTDDLIDLRAVKCALDAQHSGQHDHDITVWQQQITRCDIAVRDERLNRLLAGADQHGKFACLPEVMDGRDGLAFQQHILSSSTGHQLDALRIYIS